MTKNVTNKKVNSNNTGTKEWAESNLNIYSGCSNDCKYCYAKSMSIRFKRKNDKSWKKEEPREKMIIKNYRKRKGRIMFPSTHDITPRILANYQKTLLKLVEAGNEVLIVSKPRFNCIKEICDNFEDHIDKITFRFTIGSIDDSVLKFWEPNAPNFHERLSALKYAFKKGFNTSISIEPFLDNKVHKLVTKLRPYVSDSIWIGKVNRMIGCLHTNGSRNSKTEKMAEDLQTLYDSDYKFRLYNLYKDDPIIKWKDSLKKDFGIRLVTLKGADI